MADTATRTVAPAQMSREHTNPSRGVSLFNTLLINSDVSRVTMARSARIDSDTFSATENHSLPSLHVTPAQLKHLTLDPTG